MSFLVIILILLSLMYLPNNYDKKFLPRMSNKHNINLTLSHIVVKTLYPTVLLALISYYPANVNIAGHHLIIFKADNDNN